MSFNVSKALVVLISLSISTAAFAADCTSPAAVEGTMLWITPTVKYCNGTGWIDTDHLSSGVSCAGSTAGYVAYSGTEYRFCDGSFWHSMKGTLVNACAAGNAGYLTFDS